MIKQLIVLSISSLAFFGCNMEHHSNGTDKNSLDRSNTTPGTNQGSVDRRSNTTMNEQGPLYNRPNSMTDGSQASSHTMAPDQGAIEQGETEPDRNITQAIRQNLMQDGALSAQAKNVVIVTRDGIVTLRGTVSTLAEKNRIEERAKSVASGAKSINNQLVVSSGQL